MTERMTEVNGVELCTESFGEPDHPAVLLVMGIGASMLWWEEGFCELLAAGGRFVIRYDHRETGRSVTYQPGRPEYTGVDLLADAVGVLDAYRIGAAHVVGVSAGGAFAQLLGLGFPSRGVVACAIHGTADPMFPLEHGEALAAEIPDAELLTLVGGGHGLARVDGSRSPRRSSRIPPLSHLSPSRPAVRRRTDRLLKKEDEQ